MVWISAAKTLAVTAKLSYASSDPNVIGREPISTTITFDWFEFMLATAKASHLGYIAPSAATPEVELMVHLVGPHVDDLAPKFGTLPSVSRFKDFVGTFFTGTVAAGLALRAMVDEGYVWFAHFEALSSTAASKTSPDFAMLGPAHGIALMESKGSAATAEKTFVAAVRKGYREQVKPHLGHKVGGVTATHGYSVGTWMRSGTDAEMRIAHTAAKKKPDSLPGLASAGPADAAARARLLRHNYAGAFTLAHGALLGLAMRTGGSPQSSFAFARFKWRGRRWLSSVGLSAWVSLDEDDRFFVMPQDRGSKIGRLSGLMFAVENDIGAVALSAFLGNPDDNATLALQIAPLDLDPHGLIDRGSERDGRGAVLPDGLALIDLEHSEGEVELIEWNGPERRFDRIGSIIR